MLTFKNDVNIQNDVNIGKNDVNIGKNDVNIGKKYWLLIGQ